MLNVLINAYAVNPNWGSEPGMGWNWIINIANYCNVFIITEGEWKNEIEAAVELLPQKNNIHFFYNPVSAKIREMCWHQGDWRFYWYYSKWQKKTLKIAQTIIQENKIDIIHQLNMVGFREPGQLWKIKNIPFVWGPLSGCSEINLNYFKSLPKKQYLFFKLKNILNKIQFKYSPKVRSAFFHSDALITTETGIQQLIEKEYKKESFLIQETGLQKGCYDCILKSNSDFLNILWVGRFIETKKLDIALKTISLLKGKNIKFHIIGFGMSKEESLYKNMAHKLGIDNMCIWYGKIDNSKVKDIMKKMDLFFFTSILEATSTVIPEAIQCRLPILCHDTCGFGPLVNDSIGRKIELSSPENSIKLFANIINEFYENPMLLKNMYGNFDKIATKLTFESKGKMVFDIYNKILKKDN